MECTFNHFGKCGILNDTKCSETCKFRKTNDEFVFCRMLAEKYLADRGLEKVLIHGDEGPVISVRRKKDEDQDY